MKRDPRPYLHDTSEAAASLADMIANKNLDDYVQDSLLRSAVERQLIAIGEALYQLRMYFPDVAKRIPNVHRFITFRHVLVHSYNQVEPDVAWGLMESGLAKLRDATASVLAGFEASGAGHR
jgi:uncharacterized protein with HEPN domain